MSSSTLRTITTKLFLEQVSRRLAREEQTARMMRGPRRSIPDYSDRIRRGKTRKDHESGAHARHLSNKEAERGYHQSRDIKDRPSHFNGKKQTKRLVTVAKGIQAYRYGKGRQESP